MHKGTTLHTLVLFGGLWNAVACGDSATTADGGVEGGTMQGSAGTAVSSVGDDASTAGDERSDGTTVSADASDSSATTGEQIFDVGVMDIPRFDACVPQDLDLLAGGGAAPPCRAQAPAESFDPVEEWRYPTSGPALEAIVMPLVINWTDDNDDGVVDLCDGPDVILTARAGAQCTIHVIDGNYAETGVVHDVMGDGMFVHCWGTPAVGDIDNDGWPEIVAVSSRNEGLLAIDNDGTLMWESEPNPFPSSALGSEWRTGSVGLHDIDGDGVYEIVYNHIVWDNAGQVLWAQQDPEVDNTYLQSSTAADLDGDGDLEVITAFSAHDFDAVWGETTLWDLYATGDLPAYSVPQVADLDGDGRPEVLFASDDGYLLAEDDGTVTWGPIKPPLTVACPGFAWSGFMRGISIHDYDGDGEPEFAASACGTFALYDVTDSGPVMLMEKTVDDGSGGTASTSFDFLGDATAEPVYSDQETGWAWSRVNGQWETRLQLPRGSETFMEYPVVADIDNDGSAEILIPSADINGGAPALAVFGDADSRWIQARRIYNQHAYHVTHTNEDGTVPNVRLNNWDYFNTFRANSQIEGGTLCKPAG